MEKSTSEAPAKPPVSKQTRVMLWFIPRTLSTAITKCLSFVDDIQIIFEPYVYAYYYGPEGKKTTDEGVSKMYDNFLEKTNQTVTDRVDIGKGFVAETCTYGWVKQTLEAEYLGKMIIFCKDAPYTLCGQYDRLPSGYQHTFVIRHPYKAKYPDKKIVFCKDAPYTLCGQHDRLPSGYQHTFVIRHPYKLFTSWRRLAKNFLQLQEPFNFHEIPEPGCPAKYGFEEHYDLYQHLKAQGINPLIIDADDLQRHPESIMRKYCNAVGIPFKDDLLRWPSGDDILKTWIAPEGLIQGNKLGDEGGFYDDALRSTCFTPPGKAPSRESLREDVRHMSDVSMPFYEEMYRNRIKP